MPWDCEQLSSSRARADFLATMAAEASNATREALAQLRENERSLLELRQELDDERAAVNNLQQEFSDSRQALCDAAEEGIRSCLP